MIAADPVPFGPVSPAVPAGVRKAQLVVGQDTAGGRSLSQSFDALLQADKAGLPADASLASGKLRRLAEDEAATADPETLADTGLPETSTAPIPAVPMLPRSDSIVEGGGLALGEGNPVGLATTRETGPRTPASSGQIPMKTEGTTLASTATQTAATVVDLPPVKDWATVPTEPTQGAPTSFAEPATSIMRAAAPMQPADGGTQIAPNAATLPVTLSPTESAPNWQLAEQSPETPVASGRGTAGAHLHVRPDAIAGQMAVAIARDGGSGKVELRLDPPELGRVEIHLSHTEKGALQATVVADRAETYELIRRHGDALARELSGAGYADVSLSFSAGRDATLGQGEPAPSPLAERVFAAMAADGFEQATTPSRRLAIVDGGLDIRL